MFFWRRRHPISEEELSAYLDGEMADAARVRLEAHVEECAACRNKLDELRSIRQALRELPRAAVPRSFALREADVPAALAPWALGAMGRAAPLLSAVATAAVVVFGVLVGIDLMGGAAGDSFDEDAAPAALQYRSGEAETVGTMPRVAGGGALTPPADEESLAPEGAPQTPAAEEATEPPAVGEEDQRPSTPEPAPGFEEGAPCEPKAGALTPEAGEQAPPGDMDGLAPEGTPQPPAFEGAPAPPTVEGGDERSSAPGPTPDVEEGAPCEAEAEAGTPEAEEQAPPADADGLAPEGGPPPPPIERPTEPSALEGGDERPATPEPTAGCEPGAPCAEGGITAFAGTPPPTLTPKPAPSTAEEADEEGLGRLRVAEAAAAAVAIVAGGSLALVWWRRRT